MRSSASGLVALRPNVNLPREARQRFVAGLGHEDRLTDFDSPAVHPHSQYGMQDIAWSQHGLVALTQADRMLTPIWRIGDADRVADARLFLQAVSCNNGAPCRFDLLRRGAWLHRLQNRIHAFDHRLAGIGDFGWRFAQLHRSREPSRVAAADTR